MTRKTKNDVEKVIGEEIITKDGKEVPVEITPAEYFETIKNKMQNETKENMLNLYNVALNKLKKFMVTGQVPAAKALYAQCISLEKEVDLMDKGITEWIERDIIDDYIDNVADECVLVIELKNYERDIPDEIIDKVAATKDIFDDFYIAFTDYTGEKRSKVEKERKDKDPILFGNIFEDGKPSKKMYVIGDWVDDFCDLTLDKMLQQLAEKKDINKEDVLNKVTDFSDLDDIEKALFGSSSSKRKK